MKNVEPLIETGKTTVVDVRTPEEFMEGNLPYSINIPLSQISNTLAELKGMEKIIVCCASGVRSKKAHTLLEQNGIECRDGGSWRNVYITDKI